MKKKSGTTLITFTREAILLTPVFYVACVASLALGFPSECLGVPFCLWTLIDGVCHGRDVTKIIWSHERVKSKK